MVLAEPPKWSPLTRSVGQAGPPVGAINTVTLMQPETPFGGVLDSGFGRENGPQSLEAYLVTRSVVVG